MKFYNPESIPTLVRISVEPKGDSLYIKDATVDEVFDKLMAYFRTVKVERRITITGSPLDSPSKAVGVGVSVRLFDKGNAVAGKGNSKYKTLYGIPKDEMKNHWKKALNPDDEQE